MGVFDNVYNKIVEQRERKLAGKSNGIPFTFERWREYIPDIEKGSYLGILGASGVGKSKLTRAIAVYHAIDYAMKHNYPVQIIYFALEDPAERVFLNIISHYLKTRHSYDIGIAALGSKGDFILPEGAKKLIERDAEFFRTVEKMVYIVNDCITPSQIEARCDKIKTAFSDKGDDETHIIVIVDNYANLVPDIGQKDWDAVRYFSRNIARIKLCKEYNWTVFGILQQDLETEKYIFRSVAAGKSNATAVEPSAASIGDNKIVIRDFYYAIGIFNPWKYEIMKYPHTKGYDINVLRNKVRFLNIFKSNEGEVGGRLGLYFHNSEVFTQLPRLTEQGSLEALYKDILDQERAKLVNFGQLKMM